MQRNPSADSKTADCFIYNGATGGVRAAKTLQTGSEEARRDDPPQSLGLRYITTPTEKTTGFCD